MMNSIKMWNTENPNGTIVGGRVAVANGTHGLLGLGDFRQVLLNELGIIDLTAVRAAKQINIAAKVLKDKGVKDPRILVVAHSQGTMVFYRAMSLLTPETKKMIEFYGNGNEIFVPNNVGLKKAQNYYFDNDPVPINNFLKPQWALVAETKGYTFDVYRMGAIVNKNSALDFTFEAHSLTQYGKLYAEPFFDPIPPTGQKEKVPFPFKE